MEEKGEIYGNKSSTRRQNPVSFISSTVTGRSESCHYSFSYSSDGSGPPALPAPPAPTRPSAELGLVLVCVAGTCNPDRLEEA